ncbi:D-2-hydroxyacid dehydrogenase [Candidatus Latescibacterota bacterium]
MNTVAKIVVLDGHTLNPGDLSWSELEALGACTIYDRTKPEEVVSRATGAGIILTNKTILDRSSIEQLPDMKYIGVMATGYNVVDLDCTRDYGIPVTNVPEYATPAVAQMVFALLFELTNHIAHHSDSVRSGRWSSCPDFCFWDIPLIELHGLTMGIIGYGSIGREVAVVARAFGMHVLVYDVQDIPPDRGIEPTNLDTLFKESDIISLHCPLTDSTEDIINTENLTLMKESAYLINTGRGPLVNEQDLAEALNSGIIAGAGLDVLRIEPPQADNPLISAKNCVITPHIAWASQASRSRLMKTAVGNVRSFLEGEYVNVVNSVDKTP